MLDKEEGLFHWEELKGHVEVSFYGDETNLSSVFSPWAPYHQNYLRLDY